MLNSHADESSLVDLEGQASCQIDVDSGLLSGMHSWVGGCCEDVEAFVTEFIHHDK